MNRFVKSLGIAAILAPLAGLGFGCADNTGNGALIGGAAGAGIGAIIGNNSHGRTAEGALIGGAVGAVGGAVVGNEMDKDQRRGRYEDREYERRPDPRYDPRYDAPPPPVRDYDR